MGAYHLSVMKSMRKDTLFLSGPVDIMQHTKSKIFNKVPHKHFRILILLYPSYKCSVNTNVLRSVDLLTLASLSLGSKHGSKYLSMAFFISRMCVASF